MSETIRSRSGRPLDELSMESLRDDRLDNADFAISREQLEHQARVAEGAGQPQLADNLRRAAELTAVPNERVFEIYQMLRPGRTTYPELVALAAQLGSEGMPRVSAFIAEAAEAYRARGICKAIEST